MANSAAFEHLCARLEELTELNRLETRGTIRIALKNAGLEAVSILASQLIVVVRAVLPKELDARGIADAESICERLCVGLAGIPDSPMGDSPETIFSRLGSRA